MGPGDLASAICNLPQAADPNLIRGLAGSDDAGVYKLSDELAIIQTIDFFTPIVDDPYTFGQIAAANALSDVYAMGGKPLTVMNVVCFPVKSMEITVLKNILKGGADKILEAEALLVGGHSIEDNELKYGLSVTGTIHPKRMVTNSGARAGDQLILTKPLGTGIISTAVKAKAASEEAAAKVASTMATLNKKASELMQAVGVHAATDITGFGFLGHSVQMAENSKVSINIASATLPIFSEAEGFAKRGFCPGGLHRNRDFYGKSVLFDDRLPAHISDILFDPQTSGGLLISLAPRKAKRLLESLKQAGVKEAAIIGEVTSETKGVVRVR